MATAENAAQSSTPLEEIQGVVERLTYHAVDSGYTVARLKQPHAQNPITIVGNFASIQVGQMLQLQGMWREHPKFGVQFQVSAYCETKPTTLKGIEKYLGSGLIKGVGPVTAQRIVAHFGLETLDIVENQAERLYEVPGISKTRVQLIQAAWQTQKEIKSVILFLQAQGVSTAYAVKIYQLYGEEAIAIVTENPYRLASDVYGIGFATADAIARNIGIPPHSESRYRSSILHSLSAAAEEGHCFLPQPDLIERTRRSLVLKNYQPQPDQIARCLQTLINDGQLVGEYGTGAYEGQLLYYAPQYFRAEYSLAARLRQLLLNPVTVDLERVRRWVDRFTAQTGLALSPIQREAVELSAGNRVLILTGGPGTGKTFTTRSIVALWKAMGKTIALASPTGRAAQRLSETTGQEAKTLHRLLEFDPKTMKFKRDQDNPLPVNGVIVDEASMMDVFLGYALIQAIASDCQLLLVGDVAQLPSIGPGNLLGDLIASGSIPVVQLTEIFRQAAASQIVSNAHRINQGQFPQLEHVSSLPQSDCLWWSIEDPQAGVHSIGNLVESFIPSLGFDPTKEVQVLCPMTRGEVGTRNLNTVLQTLLNAPHPGKAELIRGNTTLRVGDRVMQKVNDYNREVFNGDLGVVVSIDLEAQEITVCFDRKEVVYDRPDLNEIDLAWATTIHKSQGSEYPVVILPLFMQHSRMLNRNLIYTGLTRAQKLAIIVGPQRAIGLAVKQTQHQARHTFLQQRLR
ncbi:MAG TPA: ATP-dependent RecD-like DNA helicase [Stenomitos sp.]